MKWCYKCKMEKEETEFYPSQLKIKSAKCKFCTQKYYQDNKIKIQKYKTEYWEENKEELYEYKKNWRKEYANVLKHCDEHNIDYFSEECFICSGTRNQKYKMEHATEIKEYEKLYRRLNKDKINKYYRDRRKNDPEYNIRRIVSSSIYEMLKSQNSFKSDSIVKYLSYSIKDLKEYLESQFEPWMTWQNHGMYNTKTWNDNDTSTWTWQIDHITPQATLPYTSMEDENFKKCWSLDNLRPYSSKQNLLDGISRIRHKI